MKTLFKNGVIITANETHDWYENGYMVIEDQNIIDIGEKTPLSEDHYDDVIDLQGNWVMPGWVNTHGHAAMSILRGYADDLPLQEWLEQKMWPLEGQFTSETVRWGTGLAIVEMLKSGTTCFVDMYDHMDTVAEMVESAGIRGVLTRGMIGLGSEQERTAKLEEASSFAKRWHHQANGRITTMMSPHAPYTCPPDFISRIVDKATELDLPIHIHMSETEKEVEQNVQDYGKRPVAHLEDIGVFERPTLVAHAVHLEKEEIETLSRYDVKISHNPASNLKLGSGVARAQTLLDKGLKLSMGTDSAASNNNLDMFQEARLAALIHKGVQRDPTAIPAHTALQMGTKWGAEAVFNDSIGSLESGMEADFIVINAQQAHLQPAHEPVSHIVYAAGGHDVKDVYVQGNRVVKDGQCVYLDEEKIISEANRVFALLEKK
ncbi:amidohydrolase [Caldalkalibacillus salinus]|uniref:amidohydrolase n=1 Tax=Caldalkalibacillus salinus TaxID=2803787 RepID=UPI0019236951|nr:amidohydrolase [Caldalkalibacillus salinus]